MSLLEQQNLLAKLFTDSDLREKFWLEPNKIGSANGLDEKEITDLSQIIEKDLNYFAESLFNKRLHEVEKMLPLTTAVLDKKNFRQYFREFSNQFLPKSIKKHLEDAIEFCQFLQEKGLEKEWEKDVIKFEKTKLNFNGYSKHFAFNILRYELLLKSEYQEHKPKKKFSIWVGFRFGEKVWQVFL